MTSFVIDAENRSPMNNLRILHKGELLAELVITNQGIVLLCCVEPFRKGLEDRLRSGINWGEAYPHLNHRPEQTSDEERLHRIGNLYKLMYHCELEFS